MKINDLIVIMPGITGSVLSRKGKEIWSLSGAAIGRGVFSLGKSWRDLELPPDIGHDDPNDGVTATRIMPDLHLIPGLWRIDGYRILGDFLHEKFELRDVNGDQPGNYLEFPYDWRLSNVISAERLKKVIEPALEKWQQFRKDLSGDRKPKVIFICHSMGGLVARYYMEALGGKEITRSLITIGTPYRGSVNALDYLTNGFFKRLGPIQFNLTRLLSSMTSVYELLPTYACIKSDEGMKHLSDVDIPEVSKKRVLEALSFHNKINESVKLRANLGYEIIPIKGQLQPTKISAKLIGNKVEVLEDYDGDDEIKGDGTVPRFSAHPPEWDEEKEGRTIYSAGTHGTLQNNSTIKAQLHGLLTEGLIKKPMGGMPIGIKIPDLINFGEPLSISALAEDSTLLLKVSIERIDDGSFLPEKSLKNFGEGKYETTISDLKPGAYRITVGTATLNRPVDSVTDVCLVWDPDWK